MTPPYALLSDQHCHAWSNFAAPNGAGVNSRLQIILDEMQRAAAELKKTGGQVMILAGDLFHVRGSIDPEVFNPVHQTIGRILSWGISVYAIPGNHDLKGRETTELGNAIQSLGALKDFHVVTSPKCWHFEDLENDIAFLPWCSSLEELRRLLGELRDAMAAPSQTDVIIHAGIDGVLIGCPDHGLTAAELAGFGFRRVFAGHYHNHKIMEGGKVISIGATTHQTWSDVGTKAGFLLVQPDKITYRASHAPSFVDVDETTAEEDVPAIVDGNYVRVRGLKLSDDKIKELRDGMFELGAKGVSIQVAREVVSARSGGKIVKARSLDQSVEHYIETLAPPRAPDVRARCNDILTKVRDVAV